MRKKILVVDDDADVLESLKTMLEAHDYEVVAGRDGQEGLELFTKHEPELCGILTDARMPNLDGLQLSKMIRASGSDIPIILVTAYLARHPGEKGTAGVTIKQYHDAGINGHLEKPFHLDDLISGIRLTFDPYGERKDREAEEAETSE